MILKMMIKKHSYITVTDQFCGCGGSSQGVRNYADRSGGGVEVRLALNHWKLAIETHNTNFPETVHDCTDVSACDPRRYVSTDILITSPECTNHSLAKGKRRKWLSQLELFGKITIDPAEERSRATMWDVCRFAEVHDYNIIITENVVDARNWVMWDAWILAMQRLGYRHQCCYFNSMHFPPTPQSRDRMYVVFWKKGNKAPDLDYKPVAYCPGCDREVNAFQSWKNPRRQYGKFHTQYIYRCPVCSIQVEPYYYAAFNCIDWSIPGQRIGDRKTPLSANTMKRIEYGHRKYGGTQISLKTTRHGAFLIQTPLIISTRYTSGINHRVKDSLTEPMPTQPGDVSQAVLMPAFFIKNYGGNMQSIQPYKPVDTITGSDHHGLLQAPVIIENNGQSKAREINNPLGAVTAGGITHGILSTQSVNAFLSYYYGSSQASGIDEATNTVRTTDCLSLVLSSQKVKSIEDYTYRMLKPNEIQAAMAFQDDYVVLGNSREKVKQCGNAVTPPVMEWIIERCIESLK